MDAEDTRTGEIVAPVSLDALRTVHTATKHYMKVKGFFYILIGLSWIIFTSPGRIAGIAWIDILTPDLVGVFWLVPGLISSLIGFTSSERLHRLAWFLLVFIPTLMGAYFFISWAVYLLPGFSAPGYERAGITSVSYWAYSASAYIMARISVLTASAVPEAKGGVHHR